MWICLMKYGIGCFKSWHNSDMCVHFIWNSNIFYIFAVPFWNNIFPSWIRCIEFMNHELVPWWSRNKTFVLWSKTKTCCRANINYFSWLNGFCFIWMVWKLCIQIFRCKSLDNHLRKGQNTNTKYTFNL